MIKISQTPEVVYLSVPASECEQSPIGTWAFRTPEGNWVVHWDNIVETTRTYYSNNKVLKAEVHRVGSKKLQDLVRAYIESKKPHGS